MQTQVQALKIRETAVTLFEAYRNTISCWKSVYSGNSITTINFQKSKKRSSKEFSYVIIIRFSN